MANFRNLVHFLFLLAVIACLQIQFTVGRQLQAVKEREVGSIQTDAGVRIHARKAINLDDQKRVFSHVPPTAHRRDEISVSHAKVVHSTVPGNSPGIGHSLAGRKDDVKPLDGHSPGIGHSLAAQQDDLKQPEGHSPGIGHSLGITKIGPNA